MKLTGNFLTFFNATFIGPLIAAVIILPLTIIAISINEGTLNISGGAGAWIMVAHIAYLNAVLATMVIAGILWRHLPIADTRKSYIYSALIGLLGGLALNMFSIISALNLVRGINSSVPSVFENPIVLLFFASMGMLVGVCFNYVLNHSLASAQSVEG